MSADKSSNQRATSTEDGASLLLSAARFSTDGIPNPRLLQGVPELYPTAFCDEADTPPGLSCNPTSHEKVWTFLSTSPVQKLRAHARKLRILRKAKKADLCHAVFMKTIGAVPNSELKHFTSILNGFSEWLIANSVRKFWRKSHNY